VPISGLLAVNPRVLFGPLRELTGKSSRRMEAVSPKLSLVRVQHYNLFKAEADVPSVGVPERA
jgi:hypothetical protein